MRIAVAYQHTMIALKTSLIISCLALAFSGVGQAYAQDAKMIAEPVATADAPAIPPAPSTPSEPATAGLQADTAPLTAGSPPEGTTPPKPVRELTLPPAESNPETELLARAIVRKIYPESRQKAALETHANTMVAQMRANAARVTTDPGLSKVINDFLDTMPAKFMPALERHIPALIEGMTKAYMRFFSLEELRDINAFGETPSGARYLLNAQAIFNTPEVAQANAALAKEGMAIAQKAGVELTRLANVYVANHPEARPKRPATTSGR